MASLRFPYQTAPLGWLREMDEVDSARVESSRPFREVALVKRGVQIDERHLVTSFRQAPARARDTRRLRLRNGTDQRYPPKQSRCGARPSVRGPAVIGRPCSAKGPVKRDPQTA